VASSALDEKTSRVGSEVCSKEFSFLAGLEEQAINKPKTKPNTGKKR
jgi:hypothetical protein